MCGIQSHNRISGSEEVIIFMKKKTTFEHTVVFLTTVDYVIVVCILIGAQEF